MNTGNSMRRTHTGFTLLEMLVTVAIVGILASLVWPSYRESIAKARRGDAQRVMIEAQQALERFYSNNNTYLNADGTPGLPAGFQTTIPREVAAGSCPAYNLTVAATATTYTITGTRHSSTVGGKACGSQRTDKCGNFTLDSTGRRNIANAKTGVVVTDCWR